MNIHIEGENNGQTKLEFYGCVAACAGDVNLFCHGLC